MSSTLGASPRSKENANNLIDAIEDLRSVCPSFSSHTLSRAHKHDISYKMAARVEDALAESRPSDIFVELPVSIPTFDLAFRSSQVLVAQKTLLSRFNTGSDEWYAQVELQCAQIWQMLRAASRQASVYNI
jgi:hypothetical protein